MAAENTRGRVSRRFCSTCFNEAAAHGRGKHDGVASSGAGERGFNEAAAHGRGKRPFGPRP